ncbi:hypothetical protein ASPBRDRAFT_37998 [Aspergillus brasiliensis CBS 101740]|uniref:Uncharacterized protein n=1 Tax=Aspergillus brasiliensis (strain CBS 101740 / IMI 381727 / IBT 21946) TaxID=767769 RepID=A0A1L9UVD2_ASPBC|nr:hypothetical protein ASPBRDRAFT_37998 [Aspergillus brasiliensis CBS 101740]
MPFQPSTDTIKFENCQRPRRAYESQYDPAVTSRSMPAYFQPSKRMLFETDQSYREELACLMGKIDSQAEPIFMIFEGVAAGDVEF